MSAAIPRVKRIAGKGVRVEFSDPNHRPLRVLNFLAAHATESFTLAEIARLLDLSKGSAHRVMTALNSAGFVARHPRHKTYSLGLAVVALGEAALERYPGVTFARAEMARLRQEFGVGCAATAIVNDEYLLLAREGLPRTQDGLTLVGERRRLVPTIGIGQIAWRSVAEIEVWLARGETYLSKIQRQYLRDCLPLIRQRGWSAAANGEAMQRMIKGTLIPAQDLSSADNGGLTGMEEVELRELQAKDVADLSFFGANYIAAPAFAPDGSVALEIVISAFPPSVNTPDWQHMASAVVSGADAVTAKLRGRRPK
jgi:DNA-binding IclR family transcriptional regulator